ncbi:hypothetical protein FACS1894187_17270 [Synergistales bacterium]|nr:hypothetical protein FACS1894187_17270 [Synergistales bacterium]
MHYGRASAFFVYDVEDDASIPASLIEKRRYYRIPSQGPVMQKIAHSPEELENVYQVLRDCDAIFTARIGGGPAEFFIERGIRVFQIEARVDETLAEIAAENARGVERTKGTTFSGCGKPKVDRDAMRCVSAGGELKKDLKVSQLHPCFGQEAHNKFGRLHLPVSESCNIQCRFCSRAFNKTENKPGVTGGILRSEQAVEIVRKALELCPDIKVVGIAGPGDALAANSAIEAFRAVHAVYPELIKCLSTNGLKLSERAEELIDVGVRTVTVTVNAIDGDILEKVVSHIVYNGKKITGREMGEILPAKQLEGIKKVSRLGATVKVNTVLVPGVNDSHIADIAKAVAGSGAEIYNIIPLIPSNELSHIAAPECEELDAARRAAEEYIDVFRHCKHCRADACGVPGLSDFSRLLYGDSMETFSHG